jgi:hypothetical protein
MTCATTSALRRPVRVRPATARVFQRRHKLGACGLQRGHEPEQQCGQDRRRERERHHARVDVHVYPQRHVYRRPVGRDQIQNPHREQKPQHAARE